MSVDRPDKAGNRFADGIRRVLLDKVAPWHVDLLLTGPAAAVFARGAGEDYAGLRTNSFSDPHKFLSRDDVFSHTPGRCCD